MNTDAQYIAIFDHSAAFCPDMTLRITQSNSVYFAVTSSSLEDFQISCQAVGRPALVIVYDFSSDTNGELRNFKSTLSKNGIPWLVANDMEGGYSWRNEKQIDASEIKSVSFPFVTSLNSMQSALQGSLDKVANREFGQYIQSNKMVAQATKVCLTPRQEEVYDLILRGFSNKNIARSLGIAECTVKEHVTGILQKLGFKTRVEALSRALVPQA